MESLAAEMRFKHTIYVTVEDVRPAAGGGFWVHFEGSRESLHLPDVYEVGDKVKITFERVD